MIDENREVTKKLSRPSLRAKKELDAMGAFRLFDVCEKLPRDGKVTTTRWDNVPKGDKSRCRCVARLFRHDDPQVEWLYTSGSTAATGGHACGPTQIQSCASMRRTQTFTLKKTRKFINASKRIGQAVS